MRVLGSTLAVLVCAASARADDADVRAALVAARGDVVDAAAALARDDGAEAAAILESARAAIDAAATESARIRVRTALHRLERARDAAAATAPGSDAAPAVLEVRRAAAELRRALLRFRTAAGECEIVEGGGRSAAVHGPGFRALVRVRGAASGDDVALTVVNDDPARRCVETSVVALGRGRFRVTWGSDAGAATIEADCDPPASLRAFNTGASGALAVVVPGPPNFGGKPLFARTGEAASAVPAVTGDAPLTFDVSPPLAEGLTFDAATGAIGGAATTSGPATTHRVTVRNARSSAFADVVVDVDPPLPDRVESLAGGFAIEAVAEAPAVPVKMAPLADGRVLFSEQTTGKVRVIDAAGELVPAPLVTVPILPGYEQGLLGIAPSPDFAASGRLYVFASAPAEGSKPARNRILGYTVSEGGVAGPDVIADDLPLGVQQNGGHLAFGPDGLLYATTGDTADPPLAQDDASLAGRVLRIAPDGSVPASNPIPGSPEWCRGFRNPFGLTFAPVTGYCFVSENGPAANDELDYVQPGKNFGWGAPPDAFFGELTGVRVFDWPTVIVPTGIAAHDGTQFGAPYASNLFLGTYDRAQVRRLVMEGVDLRSESVFVQFDELDFAQKPLDVVRSPDGSLWISTFATIWRVRRD